MLNERGGAVKASGHFAHCPLTPRCYSPKCLPPYICSVDNVAECVLAACDSGNNARVAAFAVNASGRFQPRGERVRHFGRTAVSDNVEGTDQSHPDEPKGPAE